MTFKAIYHNGVLRPVEPVAGLPENRLIEVTVETKEPKLSLADCHGILPDEDAREILAIIEAEFEKVDPDEWK